MNEQIAIPKIPQKDFCGLYNILKNLFNFKLTKKELSGMSESHYKTFLFLFSCPETEWENITLKDIEELTEKMNSKVNI